VIVGGERTVASSKTRQRKLARAKMERQLARRAAKVRRQRQGWAIAVVSVVAVLGIAGTAWALGAFDKAKPKPAAASCIWNDTGGTGTGLKDVGKPPATGQQRTGIETMTITTNLGVITASLDVAKAPCTAASFAYLAGKSFFANTKCHRLVPGSYLLQCGDPSGTGDGGPKYTFANEYVPDTPAPAPSNASPSPSASDAAEQASKVIYPAGSIVTANHGADTNGSQFYIIYKDSPLPPDFTLFGRVVSGLDLVQQVAAAGDDGAFASQDLGGGHPKKEVTIQALTVGPAASGSAAATPSTSPSPSPSAKS
jgi:peptidyl-prolyl cis-trans isomerase B (cyclophilin B)